jgi:predicted Na+-dependent transporter
MAQVYGMHDVEQTPPRPGTAAPGARMPAVIAFLFGRHFWIPAFAAIAAGFWLPGEYSGWTPSVPWLLGGILFCSCLKVRLAEMHEHLGDTGLLLRQFFLTGIKLLAFPLLVFAALYPLVPEWAPGLALVAMMPAGVTSMAFTDISRGNHTLALLNVLTTSAASPLTVPILLLFIAPVAAGGAWAVMAERAGYILLLLLIPFLAAQLVRRFAADFIARHDDWWSKAAMMFSCALSFVATAVSREQWAQWPASDFIAPLLLSCLVQVITIIGCLLVARRLTTGDAIAFACGALFVNNGLAVALTTRFFPGQPRMVLPAVLIAIPMWVSMSLLERAMRQRRNDHA